MIFCCRHLTLILNAEKEFCKKNANLGLCVTYLVPIFDIESKIDMEVLMVIVMEDTIRLPWLPPMSLKCDTGMIYEAMVIRV